MEPYFCATLRRAAPVLFACAAVFPAAAYEGPFTDGVFLRPTATPEPAIAEEAPNPPSVPLIFDESGISNEVIIALDPDEKDYLGVLIGTTEEIRNSAELEIAALDSLRPGEPTGRSPQNPLLGPAAHIRHLLRDGRLDGELRSTLPSDSPRELMHRYLVIRYASVESAVENAGRLSSQRGVNYAAVDQKVNFSAAPNDPYYEQDLVNGTEYFQWGLHAMDLALAWDTTKGHAQVGVVDSGYKNNQAPTDIAGDASEIGNARTQFGHNSANPFNFPFHGTHVAGIVGAIGDNQKGVSGTCPQCSVAMGQIGQPVWSTVAENIYWMLETGMQVINLSLGHDTLDCSSGSPGQPACSAIAEADYRDIVVVAAAGNVLGEEIDFPANLPQVLSVGGAQPSPMWPVMPTSWMPWDTGLDSYEKAGATTGSADAGLYGVVAPAAHIVSTVPSNEGYIFEPDNGIVCSDKTGEDTSGTGNDGYAGCSGTSMSSPHIAGLAGLIRSINPRLGKQEVVDIIRNSADLALMPSEEYGYGLPSAPDAVDAAVAATPNLLTPLFSFYSSMRKDRFYTTNLQMAEASLWGTLQPVIQANFSSRYVPAEGYVVSGTPAFPGGWPSFPPPSVSAASWIFTTPKNPKDESVPLAPLYRLSWKCTDYSPYYPTSLCSDTNNYHTDVTYTADPAGVSAFQQWGYKLDGIEGYIYPKSVPQPAGTVRLMRKYNPNLDDHAIFPETQLSTMTGLGYTQNSGSDWLGYVYPNTNGNVPTIQ